MISVLVLILPGLTAGVTGAAQENTTPAVSWVDSAYRCADLPTADSECSIASQALVSGPSVSGVPVFPQDHIWNTRVDSLQVDSRSADYIGKIGSTAYVHADFGSGLYEGNRIGIPYNIVNGSQQKRTVVFEYADESDAGPYPIPDNPLIEGGSDHHMLVIDSDAKILYELYAVQKQADASWSAGSGAIFNLSGYTLRPSGWTSADAAGLAVLPGLARYDEVNSGEINHALRFTAPSTRRAYIWPARHYASSITDPAYPPMGQRFRLKSSFNTSGYPYQAQIVLEALKKYGMILSDNGAPWYITGVPDDRWNNDDLHTLHQLKGSDFEAVDSTSLMINPDSGQAMVIPSASSTSEQIGVFRPSARQFIFNTVPVTRLTFGLPTDIPITGDWNGDTITDVGVFRPSTRQFIFNTAPVTRLTFGLPTDIPITGDWNGDTITDVGVFRPSTRQFIFNTAPVTRLTFGLPTDIPITGDWNGDTITDVGVFRPSTRQFIFNTAPVTRLTFGLPTDIPITGDWNGDTITDVGVFRPSTRQFIFNTAPVTRLTFGLPTDIPITGDWNGDTITDVGVFRPSTRQFIFYTTPVTRTTFGLSTDIPVTGVWV